MNTVTLTAVIANQRIQTIRGVRYLAPLGLKEAKELVDDVQAGIYRSFETPNSKESVGERLGNLATYSFDPPAVVADPVTPLEQAMDLFRELSVTAPDMTVADIDVVLTAVRKVYGS